MAENNTSVQTQENKTPFSKSLKSEFSKIIWPGKEELTRQTIAVVCISVVMGALIALIDLALGYGIDFLVK